jgi:exopolyphosphatase/guanosine-5'-triphosphate,3'-diphosphate pyrophosphatase
MGRRPPGANWANGYFIKDKISTDQLLFRMTVAIMDLGTNTFHLLIARKNKKGTEILYKSKIAVKLGENGITSGFISEQPFRRGVSAMKRFSKIAAFYQPAKIVAVGTAAIRNASNKNKFLHAVEKESGIKVKIISGLKEADLIYRGVRQSMMLGNSKYLVMDIGGGSTEFIIADGRKVYWKQSFELGAALLLEKFNPSDPLTLAELKKIRSHIAKILAPLFKEAEHHKPLTLIGASGSFDTFAEMIMHRFYSPSLLKGAATYSFVMDDYARIHRQLLFSTAARRKKMKGLIPMRVDMIVIASILLSFVIEKLEIKKMYLSTFALKEGLLNTVMSSKTIKNKMKTVI